MKTINVPLHELQPGDTLHIPNAKVIRATDTDVMFNFAHGAGGYESVRWLASIGATATREVPDEPEYPLDGRAAFNAMMDGETIERVMDRSRDVFVRRRWCDGKFIRGNADRWEDLPWGSNDQNAKWRIVKEKQNGN